ncbi:toxin-antitoxin system HicB family antitoxin [Solwaraspora sp. WMMB762]|uniref:toxin-antitoxin system HicB family antitoxin n=1 Tax=Solwaraspora sp. WMMB762 TaxID=3404120 RepID=UPI003B946A93
MLDHAPLHQRRGWVTATCGGLRDQLGEFCGEAAHVLAGVEAHHDGCLPRSRLVAPGEVLADMGAQGEQVPQPFADRSYSGKFNLRVGESLHRELAIRAAEDGMSLNQYVLRKLNAA